MTLSVYLRANSQKHGTGDNKEEKKGRRGRGGHGALAGNHSACNCWKVFENGLITRGQRQTLGAEQDQLPCESTGPSSGDWQETETCMFRACHTPQQPPPKPSLGASWRTGNAVVGRENAGWTTSKSGHFCPYQNCPQGHPAKKTRGGSQLNRPSSPLPTPPPHPSPPSPIPTTQSIKELNLEAMPLPL